MATIIGIDPGPERSAIAYEPTTLTGRVQTLEYVNPCLEIVLGASDNDDILVIEWPQSHGLPVGESVFRTCYWVGRFAAAFTGDSVIEVTRPDIVRHFCSCTHYKDPETGKRKPVTKANVKAALYERFGGDRSKAIGTKKKPGPLYGMKGEHVFDALACAVWWAETQEQR